MIYLYSGTPGSGKSLHMADRIYRHVHYAKSPVIGNFAFNARLARPRGYGSFYEVTNLMLTPEFLYDFSDQYRLERKWRRVPEESILLVIDEAELLFNSRDWSQSNRAGWISFFSQHRHLGYQIILVAQYARMLDRQIRALLEYEYMHRKVANIGTGGKVLSALAGGQLHVMVKLYSPLNEKVGSQFFRGKKRLYRFYDSYTRFAAPPG